MSNSSAQIPKGHCLLRTECDKSCIHCRVRLPQKLALPIAWPSQLPPQVQHVVHLAYWHSDFFAAWTQGFAHSFSKENTSTFCITSGSWPLALPWVPALYSSAHTVDTAMLLSWKEWFGLEGTFKGHPVGPLCNGLGHFLLDQVKTPTRLASIVSSNEASTTSLGNQF